MIYEKVTGRIGTEVPDFLEWSEKKYVPYMERSGSKLIGLWVSITGPTRTFLEIFANEDFEAYGRVEKAFFSPKTEEDRQILKEIPKYHIDSEVAFLRGTPLSPSKRLLEQEEG